MDKIKFSEFKEKVVSDYPRLSAGDNFTFSCHPGISCFNKCCNDVNIFLTPYDILRLRKILGVTSSEFLEKYTLLPIEENLRHPVVMLRMGDDSLNCPFVGETGCSVYSDRPWACRMYPLGIASPKENEESTDEEFYFLLNEEVCRGFEENKGKTWTVSGWMDYQGIAEYEEMGRLFKDISLHEFFRNTKAIEPVKLEMFYMACYDLDKFRDFLFVSTFFKRFEVDDLRKEKMKTDDVELLKFGFEWIRFSLFGEKTVKIFGEEKFKNRN
jgi:uncharacterized protein